MENNTLSKKDYYPGLDILKFIMALFIIGSHTSLLCEFEVVHTLLLHVFDIAVPTFFTISAFLFYNKIDGLSEADSIKVFTHTLKRLIIFYVIWWLLMLPMSLITFFSIANIKEIIFAAVMQSTFGGYWFIKALIINTVLLFICRNGIRFYVFSFLGISVYLVLAYNYKYHYLELPFSPYFSFFYQAVYFALGAILVKLMKNKRLYIGIDIKLVFAILLLLFISLFKIGDPIARFLYPFFLVPAFTIKMNANVLSCKKMRLASIIMYMTQFVFIWLYGLLLSAQIDNSNNLFSYSITKFLIVTSLTLVVSYIIYKGEKTTYFNFFKYLH